MSESFLSEVSTPVMVLLAKAEVPAKRSASSKLALPESVSDLIFISKIPVFELNRIPRMRFASSKLTSLLKSTKLTFDRASA